MRCSKSRKHNSQVDGESMRSQSTWSCRTCSFQSTLIKFCTCPISGWTFIRLNVRTTTVSLHRPAEVIPDLRNPVLLLSVTHCDGNAALPAVEQVCNKPYLAWLWSSKGLSLSKFSHRSFLKKSSLIPTGLGQLSYLCWFNVTFLLNHSQYKVGCCKLFGERNGCRLFGISNVVTRD